MSRHDQATRHPMDLHFLFGALMRYRAPLLWVNLGALILINVYASLATPVYRARAVLLIEPAQLKIVTPEQRLYTNAKIDEFYETQFQQLRSRHVARLTVDKLDLWNNDELLSASTTLPLSVAEQREQVLNLFSQRLRIKSVPSTSLISVEYDSSDARLAARVATTLAEQFIDSNQQVRHSTAERRVRNMEKAAASMKAVLRNSEQELQHFQAQYPDLVNAGQPLSEQETELLSSLPALHEARMEITRLQGRLQILRAAVKTGSSLVLPSALNDDALLNTLQTGLSAARQTLTRLSNRYGNRHPRVSDARTRFQSLRRSLQARLAELSEDTREQLSLAGQRLATLEANQSGTRDSLQRLESARHTLATLKYRVTEQRALHQSLSVQLQTARITTDLLASEATLVEQASVPALPWHPHRWILSALALISALIFSVIAAGIAERLDTRVRNSRDLLGLKLMALGDIPRIGKAASRLSLSVFNVRARQRVPMVPEPGNHEFHPVRESMDAARVMLACKDAERQVVLVTSSIPGEGKSSSSIALAGSCRRAGDRVLLIDCDLRRPGIGQVAGMARGAPGLSSILAGTCQPSACIGANLLGLGIDFLSAGPASATPGQLLTSAGFARLLENLRHRYDRIIVDTPPVLAVSDALPLSRLSDCVVYVVHSHQTSLDCVKCGISRLRQAKAPLAGFLMAQVPEQPIENCRPAPSFRQRMKVRAMQAWTKRHQAPDTPVDQVSLCHRLYDDLALQDLEANLEPVPEPAAASTLTHTGNRLPDLYFDITLNLGCDDEARANGASGTQATPATPSEGIDSVVPAQGQPDSFDRQPGKQPGKQASSQRGRRRQRARRRQALRWAA